MNISQTQAFNALHQSALPVRLNNIWDAASAALEQARGARALATSSAAMAWSLGYGDGGKLPVTALVGAVKRILRVAVLPLSVDIEWGYSDSPETVAGLVSELAELGIAGINIEDGVASPDLLAEKITAIRRHVGSELFINARTDVSLRALYTGGMASREALRRAVIYQDAGADGIFIPGTEDSELFAHVCGGVSLPVNAMVADPASEHTELVRAGVKRFSSGPVPFMHAYDAEQSLTFDGMNGLMEIKKRCDQ